jgi:hypothetical protein
MRRTRAHARTAAVAWGASALLVTSLLGAPAATAAPAPAPTRLNAELATRPAASAAPAAPSLSRDADRGRWAVRATADGPVLSWRSPVRLPVTDARPEIRVDGVVVGHPAVDGDGRTLTLPAAVVDTARAEVWLSGRRLDVTAATGPEATSGAAPELPVGPTRVLADDPGLPGPHDTTTVDYTAADLPWREYDGDLEVVGHAVLPQGVTDAPLVLFLHGRHIACYGRGDDGSWPCAGRSKPVPSHLGYDYLQQLLASQGYATVSIAANGINQQDWVSPDGGASARSALVRHHLGLLAQWADDASKPAWHDRLDTQRTVLVGHSRGGEGVDQAAIETVSGAPYHLLGQTLIAPTDFGYQTAGYLPTVTLLPYCDGDVFDLQGQRFVEAAAGLSPGDPSLRSSVLVRGANHNFFNTEWTPRLSVAGSFDDWGNPRHRLCGSDVSKTRLTAAEQRRVAKTFIAASVAAFVTGDQDAVDVVDSGRPVRIPEADALAWTHAIGGNRTRVTLGDGAEASGNATTCRATYPGGFFKRTAATCSPQPSYVRSLHWMPRAGGGASVFAAAATAGVPQHLRLAWDRAGGVGGLDLDAPLDLSGAGTTLDLRVVGDPDAPAARFSVLLTDTDGDTWRSSDLTVAGRPGGRSIAALHADTVRVDPASAPAGFDRAGVVAIDLEQVSRRGSLWVLDASARRTGLAPVPDVQLPSVSLGRVVVDEGDAGRRGVAQVPFTVNGDVVAPARFGVAIDQFSFGDDSRALTRVVRLAPGQTRGVIDVPYRIDRLHGRPRVVQPVFGTGLRNVTMSTYGGRAVIVEDDPAPQVRLGSVRERVRYGSSLRFVVTLSAPMSVDEYVALRGDRLPGSRPLRTQDVSPGWLRRHVGETTPGPLAKHLRYIGIFIEAGQRRGVLEIPTRTLKRPQGERTLTLRLRDREDPQRVTITVR